MRVICKDALICDFAQYYRIYNLFGLDIQTAAILACGLPPESRTIKEITGKKEKTEIILHAAILDTLKRIEYLYAKKNYKGTFNPPKSILQKLTSGKDQEPEKEIVTFETGEDFEKAREEILKG